MSRYTDFIEVMEHSSIRITKQGIIYVDPFHISADRAKHDADIVFVTHEHYDHYSPEDIEKVKNENTVLVIPQSMSGKNVSGFNKDHILYVNPGETYKVGLMQFTTVPAYNELKPFHPKRNKWVGYILDINGEKIYISGDTDATKEAMNVICDVALVPVGGTYTMNAEKAAQLINNIRPKAAIPTHYGSIVGTAADAEKFKSLIEPPIECEIIMP